MAELDRLSRRPAPRRSRPSSTGGGRPPQRPAPRARAPRRHGPGLPARRRRAMRPSGARGEPAHWRRWSDPPGRRVRGARRPRARRPTSSRPTTARPPTRRPSCFDDPYRAWPTLGELDLHLFGEGRHRRLWEVLGAHPRVPRGGRRGGVRGVGAQRQRRAGGGRLELLGRPGPPDALAGRLGRVGAVHPRGGRRRPLQVRAGHRRRTGWS